MRKIDSQFERVCDAAFHKFSKASSSSDKDSYLLQLEATKRSIFAWKMKIVSVSEDWVNTMLVSKEDTYCEYLEELHAQLLDIQSMTQALIIYQRKLEQLARTMALDLQRFRQVGLFDDEVAHELAGKWSQNHPYSLFYSLPFHPRRPRAESEAKKKLSHDTMTLRSRGLQEEEREMKRLLMGTRMKSLAMLAELPIEEAEAMMLDLIEFI
jgi:hypothetical protein